MKQVLRKQVYGHFFCQNNWQENVRGETLNSLLCTKFHQTLKVIIMINFNFVADLSVEVQINSKFKEKRLGQVSSEYSKHCSFRLTVTS